MKRTIFLIITVLCIFNLFAEGATEISSSRVVNNGETDYLTSDRTTPEVWEAPSYEEYAKKKCETLYLWGLPKELGPATLTYEEARELAYKTPEEIAERVKTVADVLIYYWSAGFNMKYNGSHPETCWFNGKACILNNMQCDCTGAAAAAVYLLKGDYDQVGVFRILGGNEENHWSNWIYTNGKYYHVPFQEAQENFGSLRMFRKKFFVMDNLDQFPILCNGYCHPENTAAVLAFACDGELYPTNGYTYPIEAEGNVQILYWRQGNPAELRFINKIYECEYGWKNQKENHPKIKTAAITRDTINYDKPWISEKDLQIEREYKKIMEGFGLKGFTEIQLSAYEENSIPRLSIDEQRFKTDYIFTCSECGNQSMKADMQKNQYVCEQCGTNVHMEDYHAEMCGKFKSVIEELGDIILYNANPSDEEKGGETIFVVNDNILRGHSGNWGTLTMKSVVDGKNNWIHYEKMAKEGLTCTVEWDGKTYHNVFFERQQIE